ncbi:fatty acid desaturase [Planomicrobium stackebrandtii]|uniref:Fatty acid desaturase n=1 Tax=Planomicrobium stackebrandtii TaxID=253160 RepID=A0ABU0GUI2_9BACL|nr:DUF3267 domain-containing protein [Planomicrobium stackebrandtii]MDQ0429002.1 fatty acid desaturase [Planomicrobium stackebrandtii]
MKNEDIFILPANYKVVRKVNLSKDKHINLVIQLCFIVIAGILMGLAFWIGFPLSNSMDLLPSLLVTVILILMYMSLHELTHAFFIKFFSGRLPSFRIRFPFLSIGSEAYFNRKKFIIIALAPALVWGITLAALLFVVPSQIFFSVYILFIVNFAGSAGDYVQSYIALKAPTATLFQDNGIETTIYMLADNKKNPGTN